MIIRIKSINSVWNDGLFQLLSTDGLIDMLVLLVDNYGDSSFIASQVNGLLSIVCPVCSSPMTQGESLSPSPSTHLMPSRSGAKDCHVGMSFPNMYFVSINRNEQNNLINQHE